MKIEFLGIYSAKDFKKIQITKKISNYIFINIIPEEYKNIVRKVIILNRRIIDRSIEAEGMTMFDDKSLTADVVIRFNPNLEGDPFLEYLTEGKFLNNWISIFLYLLSHELGHVLEFATICDYYDNNLEKIKNRLKKTDDLNIPFLYLRETFADFIAYQRFPMLYVQLKHLIKHFDEEKNNHNSKIKATIRIGGK